MCLLSNNIMDYNFVSQGKTKIPSVDDAEECTLTDVSLSVLTLTQRHTFSKSTQWFSLLILLSENEIVGFMNDIDLGLLRKCKASLSSFKSVNQHFCCLTTTHPSFYYVVGIYIRLFPIFFCSLIYRQCRSSAVGQLMYHIFLVDQSPDLNLPWGPCFTTIIFFYFFFQQTCAFCPTISMTITASLRVKSKLLG